MSKHPRHIDAIKLDRNMSIEQSKNDSLVWLSPLEGSFHIAGFPWFKQEKNYRRLPSYPTNPLPPAVQALANCTAGGQIRFHTNSSVLSIRVKLTGPANMYHMTATGQCGFDCYLGDVGNQHFLCTTRFDHKLTEYEAQLYDWKQKRALGVTLYFPLYQGVEEVWIGLDLDAEVYAAPAYISDKPVVIYGTSITQGGCASRPGMAYPNILSRSIPLEFFNLGFSGNGKGEAEVARTIAGIEKLSLFVLDYEANSGSVEDITATLPSFIRIIREHHPKVPILVISNICYAGDRFYPAMHQLHEGRRKVQKDTVERLRGEGDTQLHFLNGFTLLGEDDASECTVDGSHPTDLGFLRMAQSLEPVIRRLLNDVLE